MQLKRESDYTLRIAIFLTREQIAEENKGIKFKNVCAQTGVPLTVAKRICGMLAEKNLIEIIDDNSCVMIMAKPGLKNKTIYEILDISDDGGSVFAVFNRKNKQYENCGSVFNTIDDQIHRSFKQITVGTLANMQKDSDEERSALLTMKDLVEKVMDEASEETKMHLIKVKKYTGILLREYAALYPEENIDNKIITTIEEASIIHDIGKIGIDNSVLHKPGKLTPEEYATVKKHVEYGCYIQSMMDKNQNSELIKYCYEICKYHHERYDGNGYPDGVKGDAIPFSAQIVALADVYDALTSFRSYRVPIAHVEAIRMINAGECGAFSPKMLKCLNATSKMLRIINATILDA